VESPVDGLVSLAILVRIVGVSPARARRMLHRKLLDYVVRPAGRQRRYWVYADELPLWRWALAQPRVSARHSAVRQLLRARAFYRQRLGEVLTQGALWIDTDGLVGRLPNGCDVEFRTGQLCLPPQAIHVTYSSPSERSPCNTDSTLSSRPTSRN
jgi:hypothetical protein